MAKAKITLPSEDFLRRTAAAVRKVEAQGPDRTGNGQGSYRPTANPKAVPFKNESGETIPPYAVMRIAGGAYDSFGNYVHNVAKPDAEEHKVYLVNGRESVPDGSRSGGHWWFDRDGQVLVSGTAEIGKTMGPSEGSWAISTGKSGFIIVGESNATSGGTTLRAIQQPGVPDEEECEYVPMKWEDIAGYVAGERQVLMHAPDSCPAWVTVAPCPQEE